MRERLVAAGRDLFSGDGYDNASTAAIARRAGTSESQLVKHFGGKEELLEAIFDEAWIALDTRVRQAIARGASPLDRLMALAEALISGIGADQQLRSLMLLQGRRLRKRGVALSTGFRAFVGTLDGVLGEMQAAGQLVPGVHLEAARSALMGAGEGLLRDRLLAELMGYPAHYGKEEVGKAFALVVTAFLSPSAAHALARRSWPGAAQGRASAVRVRRRPRPQGSR